MAGRGLAENIDGAIAVVAIDHLGPSQAFDADEGSKRHHIALRRPYIKSLDVGRALTVSRVGLHQNLPCPAEAIKVVHVESAEERLQRIVDIAHRNAKRL